MLDIDEKINEANQRLKLGRVGVAIVRMGERLYLQATLPPKPGSYKSKKHQQKIALGIYANPTGLKTAEKEALKIGGLLACKEFSWAPYLKSDPSAPEPQRVREWVAEFEQDYFERRLRSRKSETTWLIDYKRVFDRLPQDQVLDIEMIKRAIIATTPDSRSRKRACLALGALAKFAGIDFNTKPFQGHYSPKKVSPRDLPSDEAIAQQFYKINDPAWRWAYGLMATYGLRPHEIFCLDWRSPVSESGILSILDGKTGPRRVWPIFPEWFEQFNLAEIKPPNCTGKNNADLGNRVSHAFRRLKVPFQPYDLRHCWAIRSLEFGLDISLAAQQLGHSVKIHSEIYHLWISDRHHQRAFDALMKRSDRPLPPRVLHH